MCHRLHAASVTRAHAAHAHPLHDLVQDLVAQDGQPAIVVWRAPLEVNLARGSLLAQHQVQWRRGQLRLCLFISRQGWSEAENASGGAGQRGVHSHTHRPGTLQWLAPLAQALVVACPDSNVNILGLGSEATYGEHGHHRHHGAPPARVDVHNLLGCAVLLLAHTFLQEDGAQVVSVHCRRRRRGGAPTTHTLWQKEQATS